jgi:hypothetical protein
MKADDLITLLAQDPSPRRPFHQVVTIAAMVGVAIAAAAFFAGIGFRPDISEAVASPRFLFKFVATIALAIAATVTALRLGRPGNRLGRRDIALAIPPALLACAVSIELLVVPEPQWISRLIGHNARNCLTLIPLLSVGPLACLLVALRQGAPSNPGLAGIAAGLAASGVGATFYAANCTDDSPLFVMTWYPIGTLIVTIAGYLIGRTFLKW